MKTLPSVTIQYNIASPDEIVANIRTEHSDVQLLPFSYDSLGIDDARDMVQFLTGGDQLKIVIIFSQVITPEAQNYFLKPLEELHEQVKIVFAFSGRPNLLPTFLSRGIVINTSPQPSPTPGEGVAPENILISDFITASIPERLKIIEELLSDENRNHQSVETFLQALYRYIRDEKVAVKNHAIFMRDLPDLLSYASVRGASHKMILEYVACLI
jgi:hypothetical protein